MIKRVIDAIVSTSLRPLAITIINLQSARQRWKARGTSPKVHFEAPYDGRPIMLLALYQKGALRPDVQRLLRAARAEGLYVLAVNTLKLADPSAMEELVDCYIERPNFGRDFGSYKTGFLHLFGQGWHQTCPRLLLINDSVYFSETRTPGFLSEMMSSSVEALGATENYEIEHHLGSFCIAIGAPILRHPKFHRYWRSYRLSDVRPRVIRRGEMQLSKTLKACASTPEHFRALYDVSRFLEKLREDPAFPEFLLRNSRTSDLVGWARLSADDLRKALRERFLAPINTVPKLESGTTRLEADLEALQKTRAVHDIDSLLAYLTHHNVDGQKIDPELFADTFNGLLMKVFMEGSHIHQNAAPLIYMGLPIIKLDGVYRGTFNAFDVLRIAHLLKPEEEEELRRILLTRPYGGDYLFGWKRAAFMSGYL